MAPSLPGALLWLPSWCCAGLQLPPWAPSRFAVAITRAGLLPNPQIGHIACFTHLLLCECPQLQTWFIHSYCFPVPDITWESFMCVFVSLFLFYSIAFTLFWCWIFGCSWLLRILWEKSALKPNFQVGQGGIYLCPDAWSSLGYRAQPDPPAQALF